MSKTLGQVAFEAYRELVCTAYTGDRIPEWDELTNGDAARAGWEAAAEAVVEQLAVRGRAAYQAQREIPSRWQPVADFVPASKTVAASAARFEPLPPVDEATAGQARVSAPVEAVDDCDHPGECDIHGHEG